MPHLQQSATWVVILCTLSPVPEINMTLTFNNITSPTICHMDFLLCLEQYINLHFYTFKLTFLKMVVLFKKIKHPLSVYL